jgi:flagellar biogenesis protein FliO
VFPHEGVLVRLAVRLITLLMMMLVGCWAMRMRDRAPDLTE